MKPLRDPITTIGGWVGCVLILAAEFYHLHYLTTPTLVTALSIAGIGTAASDSKPQPPTD